MDIEEGHTEGAPARSRRGSFVEYVPPSPRPAPPAKYKLWLMVMFCVYVADFFTSKAGILPWLQQALGLSFNGALFIMLGGIVGTLLFAEIDLLLALVKVDINGETYGLVSWLKQPRCRWVHQYENFFAVILCTIVVILEEGFALFDPPHEMESKWSDNFHDDDLDEQDVLLQIKNTIKPDKEQEYERWWKKLITQGCNKRPGLKEVRKDVTTDLKGNVHTVYLTFTSIDLLNEWMTSPVRARFMRKLQPLLATPTLVQLRKERTLPDAFTDLCTKQGHSVPLRLPKKWKVWWLTTLALWFVLLFTNATFIDHYFSKWDLVDANPRLSAIPRIVVTTLLNTYVMTPFLIMIFGEWLKRREHEDDAREPWRSLNDGLSSLLAKATVILAFYGTCSLAWILKAAD